MKTKKNTRTRPGKTVRHSGFILLNVTLCFAIILMLGVQSASAQESEPFSPELISLIDSVEDKVVEWRRDIHQHPELGNREFRTAALVADHLRSLGIEVQTEVARTTPLIFSLMIRG